MPSETRSDDLTLSFTVNASPEAVFGALCDVASWWTGDVVGPTTALGDEFSYRYGDIHYSRFRITEMIEPSRVAWLVTESYLSFIEDKEEWTGTTATFDITGDADRCTLVFTHHGLVPEVECFDACRTGWTMYVTGTLPRLLGGTVPERVNGIDGDQ